MAVAHIAGNAGVAGALVSWVDPDGVPGSVTADGSGDYLFSDGTAGTYTVTPSLTGYVFTPTSQSVAATGTASVDGVNFTAATGPILPPAPPAVAGNTSARTGTFFYRQLGPGPQYEPQWGNGRANYLVDLPAVAQCVLTRLLLFMGEWWESTLDGTPWFQKILGVGPSGGSTLQQQVTLILQNRILATPYVTGVSNLEVSLDSVQRTFKMSCTVQTAFGTTPLVFNYPQVAAQGIPQ